MDIRFEAFHRMDNALFLSLFNMFITIHIIAILIAALGILFQLYSQK